MKQDLLIWKHVTPHFNVLLIECIINGEINIESSLLYFLLINYLWGVPCIWRLMQFALYLLPKINLNVHFVSDITTPSILCKNQLLP